MRHQPDAYAAHRALGHEGAFGISRDVATGTAISLCEYAAGKIWLNGARQRVAYIGALRVVPAYRNRIALLKGGFDFVRDYQRYRGDAPFAFTSIASDNARALRILTANLPGMPDYHYVGDLAHLIHESRGERLADVA